METFHDPYIITLNNVELDNVETETGTDMMKQLEEIEELMEADKMGLQSFKLKNPIYLGVKFVNVFYAEGVQDFGLDIRILKHAKDYIIAELLYGDGNNDRTAVIGHIEFAWIEKFCPNLWFHRPPSSMSGPGKSSVSLYLSEIFGLGKKTETR